MRSAIVAAISCAGLGCSEPAEPAPAASTVEMVSYDLRLLRPREQERLTDMFDRMRTASRADGKRVAVLFSADWCERCQRLDLELGNRHPEDSIGHIRILSLKEEDWEAATRLDEFNNLRTRWAPVVGQYPLLIVLDESGQKVEEMKEAIERLEGIGVEPSLVNWFESIRNG